MMFCLGLVLFFLFFLGCLADFYFGEDGFVVEGDRYYIWCGVIDLGIVWAFDVASTVDEYGVI